MRTALFWVVTQRVVVISYRSFGTTNRSHIQGSRIKKGQGILTPVDGTNFCTETSVRNYHYLLRNDPEEERSPPAGLFHVIYWIKLPCAVGDLFKQKTRPMNLDLTGQLWSNYVVVWVGNFASSHRTFTWMNASQIVKGLKANSGSTVGL